MTLGDAHKKPKSKLLGNLLTNATASVDETLNPAIWKETVVVSCTTCGAPQQTARDYKCVFCHGDMFQAAPSENPRDGHDDEG